MHISRWQGGTEQGVLPCRSRCDFTRRNCSAAERDLYPSQGERKQVLRMYLPAQLQVQRRQRLQAGEADEAGVRYGLVALQAQLAKLLQRLQLQNSRVRQTPSAHTAAGVIRSNVGCRAGHGSQEESQSLCSNALPQCDIV